MSDFDRNAAATRFGAGRAVAIDAGLRAHMIRVYNYMAIGVALTGLVAWFVYQMAGGDAIRFAGNSIVGLTPFGRTMFSSPMIYILMFGPLALVFWMSLGINRMSAEFARILFFIYAATLGLSLSLIFLTYTHASITRVFFISAASFGALSLWGYTTQRDLTAMGSFLFMGLIGVVIASIVNIFFASTMLQFIISVVGVLVFAGLTAYDTQKIKEMYDPHEDGTVTGRKAVMGALSLYLDFINLFLMLLRLFGDRR